MNTRVFAGQGSARGAAGAACRGAIRGIAFREHDRRQRRGRYASRSSDQGKIVELAREAFLNAGRGNVRPRVHTRPDDECRFGAEIGLESTTIAEHVPFDSTPTVCQIQHAVGRCRHRSAACCCQHHGIRVSRGHSGERRTLQLCCRHNGSAHGIAIAETTILRPSPRRCWAVWPEVKEPILYEDTRAVALVLAKDQLLPTLTPRDALARCGWEGLRVELKRKRIGSRQGAS
jgi:hypothetical protein